MKPILFLLTLALLATSSLCAIDALNKTTTTSLRGSYQEVTCAAPLDAMYADLLLFAEDELVSRLPAEKGTSSNLKFAYLPNKIFLQVAAGFNVRFDLDFDDLTTKKHYNIVFVVFYQPWTGFKRLVSVSSLTERVSTKTSGIVDEKGNTKIVISL